MIFGNPTWIDVIIDRVVSQISGDGKPLPFDRAVIYDGDTIDLLQLPPAEQFAVVGPTEFPVDQDHVGGGGSPFTAFDGRIRVDVASRCSRDRENESRLALIDPVDGLTPLVRKIVKVLQLNTLAVEGVSPLREPMRLVSIGFNPRKPKTGWSWCRTVWSVKFRTDFTTG
jgi:hypothetical protein